MQSSDCPCKEEVEKEEAQALAKALEESEKQASLPLVPGLSSNNDDDTITIHVQDVVTNTYLSIPPSDHNCLFLT